MQAQRALREQQALQIQQKMAQVNGFFDQLIAAQDSESAKKALEVERKARRTKICTASKNSHAYRAWREGERCC
jgi:hypothetical protein